jgi:hypothetical protein
MSVLEDAVGVVLQRGGTVCTVFWRDAVAELTRIQMVALLLLPASLVPLRAMLAVEPARHPAS